MVDVDEAIDGPAFNWYLQPIEALPSHPSMRRQSNVSCLTIHHSPSSTRSTIFLANDPCTLHYEVKSAHLTIRKWPFFDGLMLFLSVDLTTTCTCIYTQLLGYDCGILSSTSSLASKKRQPSLSVFDFVLFYSCFCCVCTFPHEC